MSKYTCWQPGCELPHYAHGMCRRHLWRHKHGRSMDLATHLKPGPAPKGRGCSVEGCTEPHKGAGLCSTHLQRLRRQEAREKGEKRPSRRIMVIRWQVEARL